jgi:Gp157 protein
MINGLALDRAARLRYFLYLPRCLWLIIMYIPLNFETVKHQALKQRFLENWPNCDEETLRDTLEGITDLHEMIAAVIRSALADEALQVGLRTRIEDMRQRLSRLAERGAKKRQLALEAMNEAGLKKLEQPDFTASARLGAPSLVVTSERDVPESYWMPQPPRLDRQTLTSDLRRGDQVPGACLGNAAPILTVRTK